METLLLALLCLPPQDARNTADHPWLSNWTAPFADSIGFMGGELHPVGAWARGGGGGWGTGKWEAAGRGRGCWERARRGVAMPACSAGGVAPRGGGRTARWRVWLGAPDVVGAGGGRGPSYGT